MEYIIFIALVIVFVTAVIAKDIYNDRKKRREFEKSLRNNYGKAQRKEFKPERFLHVDAYYKKHPGEDMIDDVTWNDLGMDEIYRVIDSTNSSAGDEYLYYCLRNVNKSEEELSELEETIRFFDENEEERVYVQLLMAKMGYLGKFSLYDYLDHLDYLGERSNLKAYVSDALLVACLAALPFCFQYAILGVVAVLIFNIVTYFREKSDIEPYVISFAYVIKMLDAAKKLLKLPGREKAKALEKDLERMEALRDHLKQLEKGSSLVLSKKGSLGGDPASLVMDYVKMTLHLDLIQFNRMLSFLRQNVQEVDEVNGILGRLETAIAIGSYRRALEAKNGYCIPSSREGKAKEFCIEEAYHPLLSEPVKNSIDATRGVLITGSNASGKSTFLKTVAINAILAQTIHTCTAKRYEAPFVRIYSSMALRDDMESGESYYIVEIKALQRILNAINDAKRPVLCFVDEVLRGTNTVERIAASTQVLKSLCGPEVICFAATHDIELTQLLKEEFDNYHFEEEIEDGDVIFKYQLLQGKATTRNAIKLLEIMGYDEEIVRKASDMAKHFVDTGVWEG